MYCSKCGNTNQDGAVSCSYCGTSLGVAMPTPVPNSGVQTNPPLPLLTLNSFPPATVNTVKIAMFLVREMSIVMEMDGVWGETSFRYTNPDLMYADCCRLFEAMRQLTNGKLIQFQSLGRPVVPLWRMKRITANEWWKKLEIEVEGAGGKWFEYPDKNMMYADYNLLVSMMQPGMMQPTQ